MLKTFHNFRQVEAANEFAYCMHRDLCQKNRPEIFSKTSKFRNIHNLHEIDKKRLSMILVTYALFETNLVSYKGNLFLLFSILLRYELPESFPLLCQTNKRLYSTHHNITTKKMNNLEVEIFCDATFKHEYVHCYEFKQLSF